MRWPWSPKRPLEDPRSKRFMALEDALDGLTARVDARYNELKQLRGIVHNMRAKDAPPEAAGAPNGDDPAPERPFAPIPSMRPFR